jgi:predicted aspartyl protease
MPAYDASLFSPPAPVARVVLRDPKTGFSVSDVPMLVDTGADVTLIPSSFVNLLSVAVATEDYELIGFDGHKSMTRAVRLHLEFLDRIFRGKFLLIDQAWGLLGRDILNHLPLVFNGPRLTWGKQGSLEE